VWWNRKRIPAPIQYVHPRNCCCLECYGGNSVPVDAIPDVQFLRNQIADGKLVDQSGYSSEQWEAMLEMYHSIKQLTEEL
jgi:hypothetical protein